jgi:hypothetical protein
MMGISFMERKQIQILSHDVLKDSLVVEKIFLNAAEKFSLFDNTTTSRVPKTIKSLVEGNGFGFGMGGRIVNEYIIVDFNARGSTSDKFQKLYQFMLTELSSSFVKVREVSENASQYCKIN